MSGCSCNSGTYTDVEARFRAAPIPGGGGIDGGSATETAVVNPSMSTFAAGQAGRQARKRDGPAPPALPALFASRAPAPVGEVTSCRSLRSRAGIALPTVLLCLVALAALLTGLMLTVSTELAVSLAHGDAMEDRYLGEGAIHAWIADAAEELEPAVGEWSPTPTGAPVRVVVERLVTTSHDENSLFSVLATPLRGGSAGRSTLALVRTRFTAPDPFDPVISATVTSAAGGRIESAWSGSPTISRGSQTGTAADYAFLHPVGTTVEVIAPASLSGDVHADGAQTGLLGSVLGGHRIRDLAWNADVRFGRYFNEPPVQPITDGPWSDDPRYDWGCPSGLLSSLPSWDGGSCPAAPDADAWRMVAIDAQNDTVRLTSHHGQGMLMVVNGHLHIGGGFVFRGLILVDGSVMLSGGGASWPPSVTGAIAAGGPVTVLDGRDPESGWPTGARRVVEFDAIAVQTAVEVFNEAGQRRWLARRVQGRPHAWIEVID